MDLNGAPDRSGQTVEGDFSFDVLIHRGERLRAHERAEGVGLRVDPDAGDAERDSCGEAGSDPEHNARDPATHDVPLKRLSDIEENLPGPVAVARLEGEAEVEAHRPHGRGISEAEARGESEIVNGWVPRVQRHLAEVE